MAAPHAYLSPSSDLPFFALADPMGYSTVYQDLYSPPLLWPKVDCFETEEQRIFLLQLPGVHKSEIQLQLLPESSRLSLSATSHSPPELKYVKHHRPSTAVHLALAERGFGTFHRMLDLPHGIEMEEIKASYEDGVLKVEMPKISREAREKQVKVEWAEGDSDATPARDEGWRGSLRGSEGEA